MICSMCHTPWPRDTLQRTHCGGSLQLLMHPMFLLLVITVYYPVRAAGWCPCASQLGPSRPRLILPSRHQLLEGVRKAGEPMKHLHVAEQIAMPHAMCVGPLLCMYASIPCLVAAVLGCHVVQC
jgi:hypothetical protein